jgi:branched-subunit amino acid aminotransferase/4-amino-4-deoxychorismate lyase
VTKTELKIQVVEQLDRGLAYGEACFETFRVIQGEVFDWVSHINRLTDGLREFGISLSDEQCLSIHEQLLHLAGESGEDVLVRITITGGTAPWGFHRSDNMKPDLFIQCQKPIQHHHARLQSVQWPYALSPRIAKFTSDYAMSLRAMNQWNDSVLTDHNEALICKDGVILSGISANVGIFHQGSWYTPDTASGGILAGVIRNRLVESGVFKVAQCPEAWLEDCEAMVLTNSGSFIRPVSMINGRTLREDDYLFEPLRKILRGESGVPRL